MRRTWPSCHLNLGSFSPRKLSCQSGETAHGFSLKGSPTQPELFLCSLLGLKAEGARNFPWQVHVGFEVFATNSLSIFRWRWLCWPAGYIVRLQYLTWEATFELPMWLWRSIGQEGFPRRHLVNPFLPLQPASIKAGDCRRVSKR